MTAGPDPSRVLYVDSDPAFADAVVRRLEGETGSVSVVTATDADEELNELAAGDFDCVVSRYELPGTNGIEFLRDVRERVGTVPFVLFADDGGEEVASDAASAGVTEYVRTGDREDGHGFLAARIEDVLERDALDAGAEPSTPSPWDRSVAAVNRMAERVVDAETKREVAVEASRTLRDPLGLAHPVIALYDADSNGLAPVEDAETGGLPVDPSDLLDRPDGIGWESFVDSERRVESLSDVAGAGRGPPAGRVVASPLGKHGVFVGVDGGDRTGSVPLELVESVVATVRSAFDRVDLEGALRERDRLLDEKNRRLNRVTRLLAVLRAVDRAIVRESGRSGLETAVCEAIRRADPYRFVWIGSYSTLEDAVSPREFAGETDDYLETITGSAGMVEGGPAVRAVRRGEPVVVQHVFSEPPLNSWEKAALANGYRSLISLPLTYDDSLYGVVSVCSGEEETFDDLERAVLREVGEAVAYAFNAVERKRALVSDTVVELEFRTSDSDRPLVRLTLDADGEMELNGVVPTAEDDVRAYVTFRGDSPEWVETEAAASAGFEDPSVLATGGEEFVFEYTVTEESLVHTALEHGGIPRRIESTDGECRIEIALARSADVREFVEMFRTKYPEMDLHASREHERTIRTRGQFLTELAERLTDRQREVLERAYFSGFFESPRPVTGGEIAASLDITQSTFSHHLRVAQGKLFALLIEEMDAHPLE